MSKYDIMQLYTQKDWEEREIEHQCELRQLKDKIKALKEGIRLYKYIKRLGNNKDDKKNVK